MAGEWKTDRLIPSRERGPQEDHSTWRGSVSMREERGRNRRRLRVIALIGAFFGYGLMQVWLATQVAERGSHVSQLQRDVSRLEEDLAVSKSKLAGRQIYGELLVPAQRSGFAPGAQFRVLRMPGDQPRAEASLFSRMTAELQRGSKLFLPEAIAQDLWPGGRGRAHRP